MLHSNLDADRAKKCDPSLDAVNGDKIVIGGHGRVTFGYTWYGTAVPQVGTFSIKPDEWEPDMLVTGYFNGLAQGGGRTRRLLPLTRWECVPYRNGGVVAYNRQRLPVCCAWQQNILWLYVLLL